MHIGIIGTGKMATALAKGWLKAGHTVVLGSRDPLARQAEVERAVGPGAKTATHLQAMDGVDAVVITLPYLEVEPFARLHAARLKGKVVVDISNPFDDEPPGRLSGPEVTASAIGDGARVVAAFKANYSNVVNRAVDASGTQRDVLYCGDDDTAKAVVRQLIDALGLRPVDCGPLRAARALDLMVPLMIEMDRRLGGKGLDRRAHWKFVTP